MDFKTCKQIHPSSSPKSDEPSTLSLRDRLRVQDTPATDSPTKPVRYQNVHGQVHAYFTADALENGREKVNQVPEELDASGQLQGETFARAGMDLHASAVEKLVQVQNDFEERISRLSNDSTGFQGECTELYSNIAYPLSKTLCSSNNFPRATISAHLKKVQKDIEAARQELRKLADEWDACCQSETEAWRKLSKVTQTRPTPISRNNPEVAQRAQDFKNKASKITQENCDRINKIDKDFMDKIRLARVQILSSMMDDD